MDSVDRINTVNPGWRINTNKKDQEREKRNNSNKNNREAPNQQHQQNDGESHIDEYA